MHQLSLALEPLNSESANPEWFQTLLATLEVPQEPAWPDRFGSVLRSWLRQQGIPPVKTLSLFSGGGGLDIAFHDAGFEIVQMVELEAKYIQTLAKNAQAGQWLAGSEPICTDIRHYSPDPALQVDFIIGGPPCQTFSAAGRRAAGVPGTTDSRGTLFQDYVRILKHLQPQGFLFENVYGIIGANGGEAWQTIQAAFRDVGYHIYCRILDAADYGVPQHRERLFIVGVKQGTYQFPYPTHGWDSLDQRPYYSAAQAIEGADASDLEPGLGGRFGHLLADIPPGLNYSFYTQEMGYPNPIFSWRSKFSDFLYKADPETPVRTIKAQGGQYTGPFSWENRRFSIAELKRLQTIPDAYEILGNRQVAIAQIGNSVPPQLGRILALSILDQVIGADLPCDLAYLPSTKQLGFRQRKRKLTDSYLKKAHVAIAQLHQQGKLKALEPSICQVPRSAVRFLSMANFLWTEVPNSEGVKIYLNSELDASAWTITASTNDLGDEPDRYSIEVYASSTHEDWGLGTNVVRLCAKQWDPPVLIALWKAFEETLKAVTGQADLVQLSGYYQYKARIRSVMTFCTQPDRSSVWHVIQCLTHGMATATQLKAIELAEAWGVNEADIFPSLRSLRAIGYEVRSHHTNPQIPAGEYLIPYAFPTLNPRSVQLRKAL